jgi:hypothetical protein
LSTTISANLLSPLGSNNSGYVAPTAPSLAQTLNESDGRSSGDAPSTILTLSEQAKAYMASSTDTGPTGTAPLATLAANARAWFDQQYKTLGISSAKVDGKVVVNLAGQSRATLSAIASNAQGLFSKDESAAATAALEDRFSDAIGPHAVIARHTGNYAGLYDAALRYMDGAGSDERATAAWKSQRQALADGLAAARKNFGKAPDTGNASDPVHALLTRKTADSVDSTASVGERARAMLDDQANSARDDGMELVFNGSGKKLRRADFWTFDNRALATMALNPDSKFSAEEARAARTELDQRTRKGMLAALNGRKGNIGLGSLSLIQQYGKMSEEERAVLGVTDETVNRLVQNYRTFDSIQRRLGASSGLSAFF